MGYYLGMSDLVKIRKNLVARYEEGYREELSNKLREARQKMSDLLSSSVSALENILVGEPGKNSKVQLEAAKFILQCHGFRDSGPGRDVVEDSEIAEKGELLKEFLDEVRREATVISPGVIEGTAEEVDVRDEKAAI